MILPRPNDLGGKFMGTSDNSTTSAETTGYRTLRIPIYPHLVILSVGLLYEQDIIRLDGPALRRPRAMYATLCTRVRALPSSIDRPLLALVNKKRSREPSLTASGGPSKRRMDAPSVSDEIWYASSDAQTDSSSKATFGVGLGLPDVESTPSASVDQWLSHEPSPPVSSPPSPTLTGYQGEASVLPPNGEWREWPQHWRDVVVRPVKAVSYVDVVASVNPN